MYMVKIEVGINLVFNILFDFCDCFYYFIEKKFECVMFVKFSIIIFNFIFDVCVRFRLLFKG